jgi:hypothetical protein
MSRVLNRCRHSPLTSVSISTVVGSILADRDARPHRARCIEIFREIKIEGSARRLPRRSDAPIREHRDPPNVILQLGGLQIHPSLAKDDCNLALVVQPIAPFGIDELAIGTNNLASELPKSPNPALRISW